MVKEIYGLTTPARRWQLMMGDFIKSLGFKPTRADHNVWYNVEKCEKTITYISTYVDDFMIIGLGPSKYMDRFKEESVIRHIKKDPTEYLGTQWSNTMNGK